MSTKTSSSNVQSLQHVLDTMKADWEKKAPKETQKIYNKAIEDVAQSTILKMARNIGDTAPDFSLTNATGETIQLSDYLQKGPVVLTWYRGGWCPYCNIALQHLQQHLSDFKATHTQLLALTPELPDRSLSTKEKNQLEFEVLSDVGNTIAKTYGIVFTLSPEVATSYLKAFDMHGYNGDASNELPLTATYVIDQDHIIRYASIDADYRNRAEPSEILSVLQQL